LSKEELFMGAFPEYWNKLIGDSELCLSRIAHQSPEIYESLEKEYNEYKRRSEFLAVAACAYDRWSAVYLKLHYDLSRKEKNILKLKALGLSNQAIALREHVALDTVKTHARNIFKKLHLQSKNPESKDLNPRVVCSQFVSLVALSESETEEPASSRLPKAS